MISTGFCISIHEAFMTVEQLFGHVFALKLQRFYSFGQDALFRWIGEILDTAQLILRISSSKFWDLYRLFLYFTCTETSFMFGEQEVLIPSILLCSLCDSLNSFTCVVAACGLEKSQRNLLAKKHSFVLINLITLTACDSDIMWLVRHMTQRMS